MKHCQRHGPEKDPYCVDCWKDERERDALCPSDATTCSPSSLTRETDQLEECDQYKVDEDYAEYNAYRRMVEHARTLERERDEWRKKAVELHKVKTAAHDALIAAGDMIYRIARTNDDYIAAQHFKRCGQSPENAKVMTRPGQDSTNTTDEL